MKHTIEIDGISYVIPAQTIRGDLWIHFRGRTLQIPGEGPRKKRKGSAAQSAGELLAPMPGKITKILTQAGQSVRRGQPILVMEAMKMEYTLKADVTGIVSKILCQVGDQVPLGKSLAQIQVVETS